MQSYPAQALHRRAFDRSLDNTLPVISQRLVLLPRGAAIFVAMAGHDADLAVIITALQPENPLLEQHLGFLVCARQAYVRSASDAKRETIKELVRIIENEVPVRAVLHHRASSRTTTCGRPILVLLALMVFWTGKRFTSESVLAVISD